MILLLTSLIFDLTFYTSEREKELETASLGGFHLHGH